jgi:valyl-tRNA synthetase
MADKTPDMEKFYPTSVLVTAYDIIFFWVARMIFSGIQYTGQTPFHTVLIHGLVRDPQGRKMSKSLGNGIDPLEVIDRFGADALRYAMTSGARRATISGSSRKKSRRDATLPIKSGTLTGS